MHRTDLHRKTAISTSPSIAVNAETVLLQFHSMDPRKALLMSALDSKVTLRYGCMLRLSSFFRRATNRLFEMTTLSPHASRKLTPEQTAAVKEELGALLSSEQFSGTKRCHDFLKFVVDAALAGEYENLTERVLGAELFGRPIDYETGSDAIVRVRANDVRRRLAQYYSGPHPVSHVSISLPCGSYIPEFAWRTPKAPAPSAGTFYAEHDPADEITTPPPTIAEPSSVNMRYKPARPIYIAAILMLVVCAGLILLMRSSRSPDHALRLFWQPLIGQHVSAIVCFGNTYSFWPSAAVKQAIEDNSRTFTVNPGEITEIKDDSATEGNLRAAVSITNLLYAFGVSNELRWPEEVQSVDLERSNVIFIGAFNNPWSMSLNRGLRFYFKEVHTPSESVWMVQDRTSPHRNWSITKAYPEENGADYALITRIYDREGKRVMISVGGLSQFGTQAAGEFLTNEEALNAFERSAPAGWEHRNLQIVLGMRVDGREIVSPTVLATNFW